LPLGISRLEELDVVEDLIATLVGEGVQLPDDPFAKVLVHGRESV
jgi:hypothetical protein